MRFEVVYDDGRPASHFDTEVATAGEPYAWDGKLIAAQAKPLEGYDRGASANCLTRLELRAEGSDKRGIRVETAWSETLVRKGTTLERWTGRKENDRPVDMFRAFEQAGRFIELVAPKDVGAVSCVSVDGVPALERRFGRLCDARRQARAAEEYGYCADEAWREFYGAPARRLRPWREDPHAREPGAACALHELARWANPGCADPYLSASSRRPVWDDEKLCLLTGWPQEAWWRCAAREYFRGRAGFYGGLTRSLALALTVYPAAEWLKGVRRVDKGSFAEWYGGALPARDPWDPRDEVLKTVGAAFDGKVPEHEDWAQEWRAREQESLERAAPEGPPEEEGAGDERRDGRARRAEPAPAATVTRRRNRHGGRQ